MAWHFVPSWTQRIYPNRLWRKENSQDEIYLTFDDGPVPGVTDYVLDILAQRGMKATFFMVGDNVRKYPDLAKRVAGEGHTVANHTFNHLNGWRTSNRDYLENVEECTKIIQDTLQVSPEFFRPPYGLISSFQAKEVSLQMKVTMWDVLSGDYQKGISPQQVLEKTKKYSRPGSIVLFHDQQKTREMLPKVLLNYLDYLHDNNWKTAAL
ncbi:polysaccharide deacetylase family protein [Algoriphagus sediminis]|uniref:Polysaccharide deacetylase family protein n=1 Tax=Algoriphagus sediminis TaxID=3057113 RepID=A0ABT7Y952_9BACT|nr:polysaccharide deacetylase family protein [Algoriphagus sediminis]MDN3203037.1 polysaccharide deacetylase family protein [Algoriphagus sediminis]